MEDYLNSFYFRKATSRKIEDDLKLKMEEDLKKMEDDLKKWKTAK